MNTADVRQRFLDFFATREHVIVPSAPLVYNDPTLLFVNAGMVPFKPYFTGAEQAPYRRAVSVQKCVRTLDIEEVGKTTRHGTFFQMLGNFSFGDYFKEGAIRFAWDLVTGSQDDGGFGFDPEKIWVTVYLDDDEANALWQQVGVPPQRIQRRGLKDNYWHMGIPGPGGPCSEIYVDRGPEFGSDGGPEADEDRFLEIWNLVFQTEVLSDVRSKTDFDVSGPLPSKNIDTGAGLERIAYLLQGVDNMYEIDEVRPVLDKACELSGRTYGADHLDDIRMRVVADHIRSSLMLMTDGVTPGNEARGYVLRRLLRRSIRSMRLLGVLDPVLPELLPVSRDRMSASYPEIGQEWARVSQIAYAEEEAFRRTLAAGTQIFDLAATEAKNAGATTLSGDSAFKLHDTYGFPIDLTLEMAEEQGLAVDREGFARLMQEQKDRAKADAKAKKGGALASEAYATLRGLGEVPFLGYTDLTSDATVRGIVADGQLVQTAGPGEIVEVVLDQTPFYAEAGGQDADTGLITGDGLSLEVLDVQRPVGGLVVHQVRVDDGELAAGARVVAAVDAAARYRACQAHTATHIVNAALRQLLGPSTHQAGSYNKPGYLRFDFNAAAGLSTGLQQELEGVANEAIRADYEVTDRELPLADAKALGAQAMFGEKYGDIVRMVELAGPWSRELCGGTHVARTSQIGLLSLLGESSVGSGIRRVEAFVNADAFDHLAAERALVATLADLLKVQPDQLTDRVGKLISQVKAVEKELADLRGQQLLERVPQLVAGAEQLGEYRLVADQLPGIAADELRTLATQVRAAFGVQAGVVALVGGDAKPALIVATTSAARDLGARAGALVGVAAPALGGRGGGRDDLAQGGGSNPEGSQAALDAIRTALRG
ncbi:MAG: alanine--tRNA ligase [Propionicimonas sp.]|uniref:alanine--tRNA ligase n=1 Tax=Propionicimonas sp. TaxID=1955623 RepID=UPI002B1FF473|nr:alanine--tRNA ligase [Propionicimonas sp.]MEA4943111.1 alanine--tRNA ligase [Propionicimonas sp.]